MQALEILLDRITSVSGRRNLQQTGSEDCNNPKLPPLRHLQLPHSDEGDKEKIEVADDPKDT